MLEAKTTEAFRTLLRIDALRVTNGRKAPPASDPGIHDSRQWSQGVPLWLLQAMEAHRGLRPGQEAPVLLGVGLNKDYLAEEVGFEPTVALRPQRFSRPSDSSALALLPDVLTWTVAGQALTSTLTSYSVASPIRERTPNWATWSNRPRSASSGRYEPASSKRLWPLRGTWLYSIGCDD